MTKRLNMIYWRGERYWLGKLLEYPEIMTQGETLEELEENLRDAFRLMVLDEVPDDHHIREIAV
ncbi:MAG: type II toxin-antitoxin system HicB family antitoxin [Desulfomonile sp.]|jgi:predicted RNase H-like HicB family nuclease